MTNASPDSVAANLQQVRERIYAAARRAHRDPGEITLVAVTKTLPSERIRQAYELGLRDFGENRVQEAAEKIGAWLGERPTWHLIGHLQRNKARLAVQLFDAIQSVDSVELARALEGHAARAGRHLPILLEVNVGGEASKAGFSPDQAFWQAVPQILALPHLEVQGLMTVAPVANDPQDVRPVFRRLRGMRDELRLRYPSVPWLHLSMGMTDDYEVAIEEGATIVRLGRAIFGARA
jgi:hypothetical protein